jgi:hypothetical protein
MCDGIEKLLREVTITIPKLVEISFRGSNEARKELQLQVESCEVKGVAAELMINGSSLGTQSEGHIYQGGVY